MKFKLEIDCDNAAFENNTCGEVARILAEEARKMERFSDDNLWSNTLLDINGNKVGTAELK